VPIGVIAIIYESRPNVTIDCAVLCLKSGNACILRGGKEAFDTTRRWPRYAARRWRKAAARPRRQLVPTPDRAALAPLLKLDQYIHCIIPRGGEALIRYVAEHATVPSSSTSKACAPFMWTGRLMPRSRKKSSLMPRCNAPACAMPRKICSSTKTPRPALLAQACACAGEARRRIARRPARTGAAAKGKGSQAGGGEWR